MSHKILVLYASKKGTTKGIAEHITTRLSAAQPPLGTVTCISVTDAPTKEELKTYDAIILGSAIHNAHWLSEMTHFLAKHVSTTAPTPPTETATAPPIDATNGDVKVSPLHSIIQPPLGIYAFSVGVPNELPKFLRTKEMAKEEELCRERLVTTYGFGGILKGHGFFGGVADKSDVPHGLRNVFRWVGGTFGDFRDEGVVDGWVDGVVAGLRGEEVVQNREEVQQ